MTICWVSLFKFVRVAGYHLSQYCELLNQSNLPLIRKLTSVDSSSPVRKHYRIVWQYSARSNFGHVCDGAVLITCQPLVLKLVKDIVYLANFGAASYDCSGLNDSALTYLGPASFNGRASLYCDIVC